MPVFATQRMFHRIQDHPLDYASFEGEIPQGEYGAGTVEIWDKGTYDAEKWDQKEIILTIHGQKLTGTYCLIKFKDENWLFFKKKK